MNKKVLVTGADGFIGSHLVEMLLGMGCQVKAFVYYNSFNSWGWLDFILESLSEKKRSQIEIFSGDIRDPNGVRKALRGMQTVFHLAALIGIPFSYHSPDSYVDTNVKGTLNILQACREYEIERLIVTSTSEVYGTARYVPIDEKHPLQGQSPYSATKIAADKMAESFYRSFGLPVVIARPFNTYGPRQSARAVIPTVITQLLSGMRTIHLGSLHPTRDFNFVTDICRGFIALAGCDQAIGKEVNIGSGTEVSIGELVNLITARLNTSVKIVVDEGRKRPPLSEVERLVCDNSLIRDLTDWRPEVSIHDGLDATIAWFKAGNHLSMYKANLYNV